jgi:hypothetical protein
VQVVADQMNPANLTLSVGAVSESVTVNGADLPAIDTESGQIAGRLPHSRSSICPPLAAMSFKFFSSLHRIFGRLTFPRKPESGIQPIENVGPPFSIQGHSTRL